MSRTNKTIKTSTACADHFEHQCPGHLGEPNFRCMCECHTTNPPRVAAENEGHCNAMHDAMALLARAVDQWMEPIENDEPISGAAAVEWLQEFILEAKRYRRHQDQTQTRENTLKTAILADRRSRFKFN